MFRSWSRIPNSTEYFYSFGLLFYQLFVIWNESFNIEKNLKKILTNCSYKYLLIRNDSLHFKPYDAAELKTEKDLRAFFIIYKLLKGI